MLLFDQLCRRNTRKIWTSLIGWVMVFAICSFATTQAGSDNGITTLIITNPFECSMDADGGSILLYSGDYYTKYTSIFFDLYSEQTTDFSVTGDIVWGPLTGTVPAMQNVQVEAELATPDGVKHIMTLFSEGQTMCVSDSFEVYLDTSWPTPPDPVIPLIINDSNGNPDLIHFIWLASVDTGVWFDSYTFVLADNEAFLNAYQVTGTQNFWQVPVSAFSHTGRWFWQVFAYDYLENMTPGIMGAFTFDLTSGTGSSGTGTNQNTGDNSGWGPWWGSGTGTNTGNVNIWGGSTPPSVTTLIPGYLFCSGSNLYASNIPGYGWGNPTPTPGTITNINTNDIQDSDLGDLDITPPTPPQVSGGPWGTMLPAPQSLGTPISPVHPVIPSTPDPSTVTPLCTQNADGKWSCQPTTQSVAVGKFIPFSILRKLPPFGKKVALITDEDFIIPGEHGAAPTRILKVPASILPILLKKLHAPASVQIYLLMMNTQYLTYSNYDLETLRRRYRMRRNRKQDPAREIVRLDNEWYIIYNKIS